VFEECILIMLSNLHDLSYLIMA